MVFQYLRLEKEPSSVIAKSIEQHLKYFEKSIDANNGLDFI